MCLWNFLEKKLKDEGYLVESAKNGDWGLKEAEAKNFDLIITDLVMPAMSGAENNRQTEIERKNKNIPIIVLSASCPGRRSPKRLKNSGSNAFFLKTRINPSDLSRKVDEILEIKLARIK